MTTPTLLLRGRTTARTVLTTPTVDDHLAAHAPVAIGVSGGKDSTAVALATCEHLDRVGHVGPRVLVHADLGMVEWQDSLPTCERLAERLGLELVVVKRKQGGMMERWEQRWKDNVARWESLSCVKLILPWSTPAMRFCTAELKVDQITRELVRRFPGRTIVNVTGIRREESVNRSKSEVCGPQPKLTRKPSGTDGIDWLPIADWTETDVYQFAAERQFTLHEGYARFGSKRISCVVCILATANDHHAAARDERNHTVCRRMVALEAKSTFAFQGSRWLGDTLANILTDVHREAIVAAKYAANARKQAEKPIPKHLLYSKGWPTCIPTHAEAKLLAEVRQGVATAVGLKRSFVDPESIVWRYETLMQLKAERDAKQRKK